LIGRFGVSVDSDWHFTSEDGAHQFVEVVVERAKHLILLTSELDVVGASTLLHPGLELGEFASGRSDVDVVALCWDETALDALVDEVGNTRFRTTKSLFCGGTGDAARPHRVDVLEKRCVDSGRKDASVENAIDGVSLGVERSKVVEALSEHLSDGVEAVALVTFHCELANLVGVLGYKFDMDVRFRMLFIVQNDCADDLLNESRLATSVNTVHNVEAGLREVARDSLDARITSFADGSNDRTKCKSAASVGGGPRKHSKGKVMSIVSV